jgi:hypothetical protein
MDGVFGQVRVGDVALNTLDRELAAHGAAAAVLDHVAGALHRGGLADDAVVQRSPRACARPCRPPRCRPPGLLRRWSAARRCSAGSRVVAAKNSSVATTKAASEVFHVAGAAPKQAAVAVRGGEGRHCPTGCQRAGGHDIGMAGKHHGRVADVLFAIVLVAACARSGVRGRPFCP